MLKLDLDIPTIKQPSADTKPKTNYHLVYKLWVLEVLLQEQDQKKLFSIDQINRLRWPAQHTPCWCARG